MNDTNIGDAPLISVALPVYNGERYLSEAIDSILTQSFKDFELIIINDGSKDNSLQLLQKYQKLDSRIRLISRENKNVAATLNEIILIARGKWIARMDQDDISLPYRFERQLKWLEQTGADICGSWVQLFGTNDKRILKHCQTDEAIKMEMLFCSPFAHPSVIVRKDLIGDLLYNEIKWQAEDYDLWERAAKAGWKMTNIPEVLMLYRVHAAQISTASSSSIKQKQFSQDIRYRYWHFIFDSKKLNKEYIGEVMKLNEVPLPKLKMDDVDSAFVELLNLSQGEARSTILYHLTLLYIRAAADCSDIVTRWGRINNQFGKGFAFGTKLKLWLLKTFRVHSNSRAFDRLKRLYFFFFRQTWR